MNKQIVDQIRCGNCKSYHATIQEVKDCHLLGRPVSAATVAAAQSKGSFAGTPATQKQIDFLKALAAERPMWADVENMHPDVIERLTVEMASSKISEAKAILREVRIHQPDPTLPEVPAGHYAVVSATGNNDLDFFRVDKPTDGEWAGCMFVKRVIGGHPDQPVSKNQWRKVLQRIVDADIEASRTLYGTTIGQCWRCNRHLTDETSRALGIGPECRKLA